MKMLWRLFIFVNESIATFAHEFFPMKINFRVEEVKVSEVIDQSLSESSASTRVSTCGIYFEFSKHSYRINGVCSNHGDRLVYGMKQDWEEKHLATVYCQGEALTVLYSSSLSFPKTSSS